MSDDINPLIALVGAALAIKVGAAAAKGVGKGLGAAGRGIGAVANSLAEGALKEQAFARGLKGGPPPDYTKDDKLNRDLDRNYQAGREEHALQVTAFKIE